MRDALEIDRLKADFIFFLRERKKVSTEPVQSVQLKKKKKKHTFYHCAIYTIPERANLEQPNSSTLNVSYLKTITVLIFSKY